MSSLNRLAASSSAYLRQHATNPVDWYPWGKEALQKARKENKPILLSSGYATCYWCHVMERDVFENAAIAEKMNASFVNIKIDREERPDLDEIYMAARQLMTEEGGWPNHVFLTPDLKPFFAGGTYSSQEKYGRPSFSHLLGWLDSAWRNHRADVEKTAEDMTHAIRRILAQSESGTAAIDELKNIVKNLLNHAEKYHDQQHGGFYKTPKFPNEMLHLFLLNEGSPASVSMAEFSLNHIAAGGIFDPLAGGFHRYAVDEAWAVPHFEKMLYNQAMLARVYLSLYAETTHSHYKHMAVSVLNFVTAQLRSDTGAFYSAIDAETDGVEGAYYAWKEEEIKHLLSPEQFELFQQCYRLADIPVFEGHPHPDGKVLNLRKRATELARTLNISYEELSVQLEPIKHILLAARNKRKAPLTDTKIITAWNGLMIQAFAEAGASLGRADYVEIAENAANFFLGAEGPLQRIYGTHETFSGFMEDYSMQISGLLAVYKATGSGAYLDAAKKLAYTTEHMFAEPEGGYYFTAAQEELIVRIKNAADGALPSGASVMLHNLLTFYDITKDTAYKTRAEKLVNAYILAVNEHPEHYANFVHGIQRLTMM